MQEKHGRGAPTTPTMPHQRGAENYNSREAAHRGPPTLRGLQSHVQASLVNSARARAATEQASSRQRAPVHSGSGLTASVPRVPPTPAPLRKHAPDPLQTRALQARTPPGSPAPPTPGAAAWLHSRPPAAPAPRGPQAPFDGGTQRERGKRGRKQPREGGGGSAGGKATSTKHGRDCCRTTWVCLQFTNVATCPPAADKSD